jgi:hypothetical protein
MPSANARTVKRYLEPGERVRLEARPHGAALVRPLARAVVIAGLGAGLVLYGMPVAWPLGVAGSLALAYGAFTALRAVLAWDRTILVVTSAKLLVLYGVVRRRSASAVLPAGGTVEVDQSLLGRLLGYGTVVAGDLEVPYVPDPARLVR